MEGLAEHLQKGTDNGALFRGMNPFNRKNLDSLRPAIASHSDVVLTPTAPVCWQALLVKTSQVQSLLLAFGLIAAPVLTTAASDHLTGAQQPGCLSELQHQPVSVASVTDGDTLVLNDKRRVRLIGINTLELNENHPADRAWAQTATRALENFIRAGQISIIPGIETHDRYGRLLAHVRTLDGRDAGHELVSQGLAIAVAVGKNTRCATELITLERKALRAELGLWASPGKWQLTKARLTGNEKGFHVVQARVTRLTGRGNRRALILDNGLTARLGKHWPANDASAQLILDSIEGQTVKLKGWLGSSAGKTYMTLNHPANLDVIQR